MSEPEIKEGITPEQEPSDATEVSKEKKIRLKAIKGIGKKTLSTSNSQNASGNPFLKVDQQGNIISNFFSNFFSQLKNPTTLPLFPLMPVTSVKDLSKKIDEENNQSSTLKAPTKAQDATNQQNQKNMETTQQPTGPRFKLEDIDWKDMAKYGMTQDKLEKLGILDDLLMGFKTDKLIPISRNNKESTARLSLRQNESGKAELFIIPFYQRVYLNNDIQGHVFSAEDKENLLKTGNMGRLVELNDLKDPSKKTLSLVSIDRLTNAVVSYPAEWMKIPEVVGGIKLDEQQRETLKNGEPIYLHGMTFNDGSRSSSFVQYNADKKYVEYLFDEGARAHLHQKYPIEAPKEFRGKVLTDKQYEKLLTGEPVLVDKLVGRNLKEYKGYITYDKATGKTHFDFENPKNIKQDVNTPKVRTGTRVGNLIDKALQKVTGSGNSETKPGQQPPKVKAPKRKIG